MATEKQRAAARKNVKKAQTGARKAAARKRGASKGTGQAPGR